MKTRNTTRFRLRLRQSLLTLTFALIYTFSFAQRDEIITDTSNTQGWFYGLKAANLKSNNKVVYTDPQGNIHVSSTALTDMVLTTGSYANPAWITSLAGSKITGTAGGIPYYDATGHLNTSANIGWSYTNNELNIGQPTTNYTLNIQTNNSAGDGLITTNISPTGVSNIIANNDVGFGAALQAFGSNYASPSYRNAGGLSAAKSLHLITDGNNQNIGTDPLWFNLGGAGFYTGIMFPNKHFIWGDTTDLHPTDPLAFIQVHKIYVDSIVNNSGVVIAGGGGSGTVTGGAINWPGTLYTTPTTATVSGGTMTFAPALATQAAGTVLAGPVSGANAIPTFKAGAVYNLTSPADGDRLAYDAATSASTGVKTFKNVAASVGFMDSLTYSTGKPTGNANVWLEVADNLIHYIGKDGFEYSVTATKGAQYYASYDPDVISYLSRVTSAGGTYTQTVKDSLNSAILLLKANGIYTTKKELWPMIGGNAASHALGFKNIYNLTFNGGWTHSSLGADPDGTTGYAATGIVPSAAITSINDLAISYWSGENTNLAADDAFGVYQGATQIIRLWPRSSDGNNLAAIGATGQSLTTTPANGVGLFTNSRTSSTLLTAYQNGTSLGTLATAQTGTLPTAQLYLGALNNVPQGGNTAANFTNKRCQFASIGTGMTQAQETIFYTAIQKIQTALGR